MSPGAETDASGTPTVSVVVVGVEPAPALRRTLAALATQDGAALLEVLVAASWPGPAPDAEVLAAFPAARTVQEAGVGPAAAANAALAAARGDVVVLLAAGDVPGAAGLLAAHARAHAEGAAAVAGDVVGGLPARDAWLGLSPADAPDRWSRHVSIARDAVTALDGLDDRLRDLDVAVLDLVVRLREAGHDVRDRPDLTVIADATTTDDTLAAAARAGHAAQSLDVLLVTRGAPVTLVGGRLTRVGLRWARPLVHAGDRGGALAARAAFARGRGLPPLPAFPADRAGMTRTHDGTTRPAVSVVVPFGGSPAEAAAMLDAFGALRRRDGDEVVVVDNSPEPVVTEREGIRVVRATGERSSYHARNAGAAATSAPWLLFCDADCLPVPWLLDAAFSPAPGPRAGAVAGAVLDPQDATGWVSRYSADAAVLSQARALAREGRGYAVTACLLVRRAALDDLGGFAEGIRSSGDADLCWRLQEAGWSLEYRPRAAVEHRHRASLRGLFDQYRKYGAGVAWLETRWPGSSHGWPAVWRPAKLRAALVDLAGARPASARMHAMDLACEWAATRGARTDNRPGD